MFVEFAKCDSTYESCNYVNIVAYYRESQWEKEDLTKNLIGKRILI